LPMFVAPPGNIVLPPYAIGAAMAMTLSGARGETAAEMARVLRQTLPRDDMDAASAAALALLDDYDMHGATGVCPAQTTLVPGSEHIGWRLCAMPWPADRRCPADGIRDAQRCLISVKDPDSAQVRAVNALMRPRGRDASSRA